MRRVIIIMLSVTAAVIWQNALPAEEAVRLITYDEYIRAVTNNLPELKKNRLQVSKAENALRSADASADVNITAGGSWSSTDEYSSLQYGSTRRVSGYSLSTGISKKFTGTGTTVEAGVAHDSMTAEGYGTTHYPSVYLSFSQSVLKNSFGMVDRYAVNNASMQLEIEKLRLAESDKTALNYYRKLYFTWIETSARIELMKESVQYAEAIESDTERKYRSGLVPEEDILSAKAVVSQYRIRYEELLSEIGAIEAELKTVIPAGARPDIAGLDARYSEISGIVYGDIPFGKTQGAGIYRLAKNRLEYAKGVDENSLLPQLDITGKYTRKSMDKEAENSWASLDDSDYYLGFTASYPLWNTARTGTLKDTELAIDEINAEYAVSEKTYISNIDKLKKRNESVSRTIELTADRIRLLQARYDAVYRKYRQGNSQLQAVIDSLQDITDEKTKLIIYKNTLIQNYIDYSDLTT